MALTCPVCQTQLTLSALPLKEETVFDCQSCQNTLKLHLTVIQTTRPVSPKEPQPLSADFEKALVAVEGEVTDEVICENLSEAGFTIVKASGDGQLLELIREHRPAVSILDVGLPQVFGSVISETGKPSDLKNLKIILVSSIHNKTRYKREPDSLYGADDYIERHHIEDRLIEKVRKLVQMQEQPAMPSSPEQPRPVTATETPPTVEKQRPITGDLSAHDAAKRLARIIISDIALYNQKRIDEGVRNDTFHELLKDELDEGLKLYQSRTPKEILETTRYYEEVIEDFIQKRKSRN
jgi:DNA-binding response OmpR family regulator